MLDKIKLLLKGQVSVSQVLSFFEGNFRYWLFYSDFKWLMRNHIVEQIEYRVQMMKKECYENGYCSMCGCDTVALQMTNKKCDGDCYPPMMDRKDWTKYKYKKFMVVTSDGFWKINTKDETPIFFKEIDNEYVQQYLTGLRNFESKSGVYNSLSLQ